MSLQDDEVKDEKVNLLIDDFTNQRKSLENQVLDLEKIRSKLDILFPEQLDNRNVMRFHEKVKSTTELYKSILDVRKEIIKSIKDEIDIRRKVDGKTNDDDFSNYDIRSLAKRVEKIGNDVEQTNKERDSQIKIVKQEEKANVGK